MKCPKCGAETPEGLFCMECGSKIEKIQASVENVQATAEAVKEVSGAINEAEKKVAEKVEAPAKEAAAAVTENVKETVEKAADAAAQVNEQAAEIATDTNAKVTAEAESVQADVNNAVQGNDTPKANSEKKPLDMKLIGVAAAAVAALVLIVILFSKLLGGSGSGYIETNIQTWRAGDSTYVMFGGNDSKSLLSNDGSWKDGRIAMDRKSAVLYQRDDKNDTYTLWYVDSEGKQCEIEDVYDNSVFSVGENIVYLSSDNELNSYNVAKAKTTTIDTIDEGSFNVVVSPDTKTVLYSKVEDGKTKLFLYDGGDSEPMGKGYYPLAVSNGGKKVFAYKGTSTSRKIYLVESDEDNEVIESEARNIMFNSDMSEIIYTKDYKMYFYKVGDDDSQKISSSSNFVLYSYNPIEFLDDEARYYNVDSFVDQYFFDGDELVVLSNADDGLKFNKVVDGIDTLLYFEAPNETYIKEDKLYRGKNGEDEKVGTYEFYDVETLDKGDLIYYLDNDETLYYIDGDEKKTVRDDVKEFYTNNKDTVILLADYENSKGDLYIAKGTKKPEKVKDDVSDLHMDRFLGYYVKEEDGEISVYWFNGKDFDEKPLFTVED